MSAMSERDEEGHDPVTGEVIGRGMPFNYFLSAIQGGDFVGALTADLAEMGAALNQYVQDFRGEPKGQIDITFKFQLKKGVVEVVAEKKVKTPKAPASGGIFYIDARNNFCQDDPRQMRMDFSRGPRVVS